MLTKNLAFKLVLILEGEGIETQSKLMVAAKGGSFHSYTNKLFSGKPILPCGAALFLSILAGYLYLWY